MKLLPVILFAVLALTGCATPKFVSTGDPEKDKVARAEYEQNIARLRFERKQTANAVARGFVRFLTEDFQHASPEQQLFGEDQSFR